MRLRSPGYELGPGLYHVTKQKASEIRFDRKELVIMNCNGVLVYVSISILLALAASNCAKTETQVQSPATSPREIWKFETGG